jgi:hypothetical protein
VDHGDIEAAREILGHTAPRMTRHYSSAAEAHALEVVSEVG